jgi:type II secretory pathway pseudopilin PulG
MHGNEEMRPQTRSAFTLVELLTVLIIITILIGILLPTITHMKRSAYNTGVQAQMGALSQAINQYYADFNSYPGPVSNAALGTSSTVDQVWMDPGFTSTGIMASKFPAKTNIVPSMTGPENLTLGLLGGLHLTPVTSGKSGASSMQITYNPTLVGQGPVVLNAGLPKKFGAYIDNSDLSPAFSPPAYNGLYFDAVVPGGISDSPVPEILDKFPNKMPILYIRANVGATMYNTTGAPLAALSDQQNPVVINAKDGTYASTTQQNVVTNPMIRYAQYDISQIYAYTRSYNGACIGEGKTPPTYVGWTSPPSNAVYPFHGLQTVETNPAAVLNQSENPATYKYPYPAYPYFKDPNSPAFSATPLVLPYARAKDTYILISAGIDRIYGTTDDITSFGDVRP